MVDIFKAAFSNNVSLVKKAIAEGEDINFAYPASGCTALYMATVSSSLETVVELLSAGAVPDQRLDLISRTSNVVHRQQTALMHAETVGVMEALIAAGADVNAIDANGWSPLIWGIHQICYPVVSALLERGASTSLKFFYQGREMTLQEMPDARISRIEEIAGPQPNAAALKMLADLVEIRSKINSIVNF